MFRIALRVTGVDLDDDETLGVICARLDDLSWMEIDGRTLAVLHTRADPVDATVQAARQIMAALSGARVLDVDQDLVGISDVARRIGVTREAVRLWVDGRRGPGGFPPPVGSAGSGERGSMRLWQWAPISDWLRQYGLHDDDDALSATQVAEVNAALLRVIGPLENSWQQVSKRSLRMARLRTGPAQVEATVAGEAVLSVQYADAAAGHSRLVMTEPAGPDE